MPDETPHYLGIGKVRINEAFLNQVAASLQRAEDTNAEGTPPQSEASTPDITPRMREKAREFIEEYFLTRED